MEWQAISCALAYTGSTSIIESWSDKTNHLMKILTEGNEGEIRIIKPSGNDAAIVKLEVLNETGKSWLRMRDFLV